MVCPLTPIFLLLFITSGRVWNKENLGAIRLDFPTLSVLTRQSIPFTFIFRDLRFLYQV